MKTIQTRLKRLTGPAGHGTRLHTAAQAAAVNGQHAMYAICLCASLFFILLTLSAQAYAAVTQIGKVTRLEGNADVLRGAGPAAALSAGDAVFSRDIIRTQKRSLVQIGMNDGSSLTIGERTRLDIKEYLAGRKPRSVLELVRGQVRAVVSDVFSKRKESFQIHTTTAVVGVQGTDFIVIARAMETRIEVLKGIVSVRSTDPAVKKIRILKAGQAAVVKKSSPPLLVAPSKHLQLGSGGTLDIPSGGTQYNAPTMITPRTSPAKAEPALPPVPNPSGR